jgi:hypothetical protein
VHPLIQRSGMLPGVVDVTSGWPPSADAALAFLAKHQPLPPDDKLSEPLIRRFDAARRYFELNPDPRCVEPILRALPHGSSGFGVYQLLDGLLRAQDREVVLAVLRVILADPGGAREWAMEFAAEYPDGEIARRAAALVADADEDTAWWAVHYLDEVAPSE